MKSKKQNLIKMLIILYLLIIPTSVIAVGSNPSVEIKGRSLAEKQIRWLWSHRDALIQSCEMSECKDKDPIKSILPQLKNIAKLTQDNQLEFKSEKENPGFFTSRNGEPHRIAITGQTVGSLIYFNTDLINGVALETLVGILIHEWVHHLGIIDDNQRIPDRAGALIAQDFKTRLFYSPYSGPIGPNRLQLVSAVFQFPVPKDELNEKYFYSNFGFFSDGNIFLDTDLSKFIYYPACDKDGFKVAGQVTQSPRWRDLGYDERGLHRLKLSMLLVNACYKANNLGQLEDYHYARRSYRFDLELDKNGKFLNSSVEALADALQYDLDTISTLEVIETKLSSKFVRVGESLNLTFKVKSFSELIPQKCTLGIAQQNPPMQEGGFPLVFELPNCEIKMMEHNIWEIRVSFTVSKEMASGSYYPRTLKVNGQGSPSTAIAIMPEEVGFEVNNENIKSPFEIKSIEVPQLIPISKLGTTPVTNSYTYQPGQRIELIIRSKSSTPLQVIGIGFYSMLIKGNQLEVIHNTVDWDALNEFNFQQRSVDEANGAKTLILTFTIPENWQNAKQLGMGIKSIYFSNNSFQHVLWKSAGNYDYLFVDQRLYDANRY